MIDDTFDLSKVSATILFSSISVIVYLACFVKLQFYSLFVSYFFARPICI